MNLFSFIVNAIFWISGYSVSSWNYFFCGTSLVLVLGGLREICKERKTNESLDN